MKQTDLYLDVEWFHNQQLFLIGYGYSVSRAGQLYPLEKTLFIFFLRHSEGMPLNRLREHRQELKGIYQKLSNQSGLDGIERSINNLVDPKSNAVYEKLSRIKREMVRLLGRQAAPEYCITGQRGETHRITLPAHLITWKNNGEAENRTE